MSEVRLCKNCNSEIKEYYCPHCGQEVKDMNLSMPSTGTVGGCGSELYADDELNWRLGHMADLRYGDLPILWRTLWQDHLPDTGYLIFPA